MCYKNNNKINISFNSEISCERCTPDQGIRRTDCDEFVCCLFLSSHFRFCSEVTSDDRVRVWMASLHKRTLLNTNIPAATNVCSSSISAIDRHTPAQMINLSIVGRLPEKQKANPPYKAWTDGGDVSVLCCLLTYSWS